MNTKYEILPGNQVKIIEEKVTTSERIVDLGAVQKRMDEIDAQVTDLQKEKSDFQALIDAVNGEKEDAKVPESISAVATAEVNP